MPALLFVTSSITVRGFVYRGAYLHRAQVRITSTYATLLRSSRHGMHAPLLQWENHSSTSTSNDVYRFHEIVGQTNILGAHIGFAS